MAAVIIGHSYTCYRIQCIVFNYFRPASLYNSDIDRIVFCEIIQRLAELAPLKAKKEKGTNRKGKMSAYYSCN